MIIKKVVRIPQANLIELDRGEKVKLLGLGDSSFFETEENSSLNFIYQLIFNRYVKLVFDKKMIDDQGNLLCYIFLNTAIEGKPVWCMINKRMIVNGYCNVIYDPINNKHNEEFLFLEAIAKDKAKRIWKPKEEE